MASAAANAQSTLSGSSASDCGIGIAIKKTAQGIVVDGVSPAGPAHGHLLKGDVVTLIDKKTAPSEEAELKKLLGGAEGSWVEVVVQRKGKDVVKVFQRRSLNPKKKEDAAAQQAPKKGVVKEEPKKQELKNKHALQPSNRAGEPEGRPISVNLSEMLSGVQGMFASNLDDDKSKATKI